MGRKNLLITGATGNVGYEVIRGLHEINCQHNIFVAERNAGKAQSIFSSFGRIQHRTLDFADAETFEAALDQIDLVFLVRPPQLADVKQYFEPFIGKMKSQGIDQIVFLSVQGVENQKMIPHYKLERLIEEYDLHHVFLRPGYFMQNLTTTLLEQIREKDRIYVPAGNLNFNWVDARDIGLVAAHVLNDFEEHTGSHYEITGSEFAGFDEVAKLLTKATGRSIRYVSPNLLRFYLHKKKQGTATPMILVMIMLHWLPRFGRNREKLTDVVRTITGRSPGSLESFIKREIEQFG